MSLASTSNENAIWSRVIHPERGDLPPEAAKYFLNLRFDQADLDRMRELAEKNQRGALSPEELAELERFRRIGLQLDLLHSKARRTLNAVDAS